MKKTLYFLLLSSCVALGCKKDKTPDYDLGQNRYTTTVDGREREYYVHVPDSYDPDVALPVVFMLHGTGQDGITLYDNSGWKEVSESQGLIAVFPSSLTYCIIDDGETKTTSKWNIYPGSFTFCNGVTPADDIQFLRQVVAELHEKFTLDDARFYMAGFSNGGQMVARCAVEMSDIFAAFVESAGTFPNDTTCVPLQQVPTWYMLGNLDHYFTSDTITNLPMALFEQMLDSSAYGQAVLHSHQSTFGYNTTYAVTGDSLDALTATFAATTPTPPRQFKFTLIYGLEHEYPKAGLHPNQSAGAQWTWMQQYTLD
jgi:poly(3-hydroxybutyrate) depolymerase